MEDEIDFSQAEDFDVPDDPGPAVMGKTPILGTVRRSMDMPVLRDELQDDF